MEVFGEARNPWDLARTTGGSSAGCGAALAAGLIPLAIGTDTGGSIRIPSSYCGITGLKPTYGRVSSAGIVPLSWSLDHPGPMGRTVRDVALALAEIAGPDDADPSTHPRAVPRYDRALRHDLRGVVLGRPRGFFSEGLDPDVAAAVDRFIAAAHGLGAIVVDVDLPFAEYSGAAFWAIAYSEALAVHRDNVRARHRDFTAPFLERILAAACLSAADLVTAQCLSKNLAASFAEAFSNVDVLVAPTTPTPASAIAAKTNHGDRNRFTRPANLNGGPAIAVPCGFNAEGLPLSVQLMGRAWNEETVLRVAFAVEREIVTDRRPALATGASTPVQEAAASPHVAESDVQAAIQVAASLGVALEEAQARRVAAQWTVCRDVLDRARPAVRIAI
jgi:aspartyl-tRNA(Asn)/glutamyl-tRNA(Gln) amidotransferase subunit A